MCLCIVCGMAHVYVYMPILYISVHVCVYAHSTCLFSYMCMCDSARVHVCMPFSYVSLFMCSYAHFTGLLSRYIRTSFLYAPSHTCMRKEDRMCVCVVGGCVCVCGRGWRSMSDEKDRKRERRKVDRGRGRGGKCLSNYTYE